MAAMLARQRKGLTIATDYLLALRRRTTLSPSLAEKGFCNNPAQRGISGLAKWAGERHLQQQPQGLAILGRRNFNLSSLRDRFKSATGKVMNGAPPPAELSVWKPVNTAKKTVIGYREALGLQMEAFWKRNYLVVVGAVGFGVCLLLWRLMFGIASTFVSLSEGMAKFGFLALAAAMVTVGVRLAPLLLPFHSINRKTLNPKLACRGFG